MQETEVSWLTLISIFTNFSWFLLKVEKKRAIHQLQSYYAIKLAALFMFPNPAQKQESVQRSRALVRFAYLANAWQAFKSCKGHNQSNVLVFQAEMSEEKSKSSPEVDNSRLCAENMQSSPNKSNDGMILRELSGARLKTSTKR